jgi:hypothetical protein
MQSLINVFIHGSSCTLMFTDEAVSAKLLSSSFSPQTASCIVALQLPLTLTRLQVSGLDTSAVLQASVVP